jgi:hypothetical protein
MDIVERMKNRTAMHLRISRNNAAGHPVMAVDNHAAAVFCTYSGNDLIHHGLLEFSRVQGRISRVGIEQFIKQGGIHQMNAVRIDGVDNPVPLIVIKTVFLLKSPAEV